MAHGCPSTDCTLHPYAAISVRNPCCCRRISQGGEGDVKKFHLFAAGFVNNCGIGGWETNSQVIHAVGDSPGGPFSFSDVALSPWHHNPDIKRCPITREYLLYTISCFSVMVHQLPQGTMWHKQMHGARSLFLCIEICARGLCYYWNSRFPI